MIYGAQFDPTFYICLNAAFYVLSVSGVSKVGNSINRKNS